MSQPRPATMPPATAAFASQCLGEFMSRLHRLDPHPAVLDLGVLCGANITYLGARGCRVSVESMPLPTAGAAPAPAKGGQAARREDGERTVPEPVSPLSYPAGSFSGVLAWDAISRMPAPEATGFAETLRRLLVNGGVLLAYFPGPPGNPQGAMGKYRILGDDRLAVESLNQRHMPVKAFQNREIYSLFSRFEVVRLSHHKSGTREVLVARSKRPGRS